VANVTIRNIEKAFGEVRVIHGIDIEIAYGAFVVLVGPSGCGKSTLLGIIAGLEDVTGGQILIGGREVNDMVPKDRGIAMVFQNNGLYPHMTVAKNMEFALKLPGVPSRSAASVDHMGRPSRAAGPHQGPSPRDRGSSSCRWSSVVIGGPLGPG
jgi:multiple sugar transport system ATP-binding protein